MVSLRFSFAISVVLLLPLGLLMGMHFPLGLKILDQEYGETVPWVWGINGAASVLGSIAAILVAILFGYTLTIGIGELVYFAAAGIAWQSEN